MYALLKNPRTRLPSLFEPASIGKMLDELTQSLGEPYMADEFLGGKGSYPSNYKEIYNDKGQLDSAELEFALAGYELKDINVVFNEDTQTLTVEAEKEQKQESAQERYVRRNISSKKMKQTYHLSGIDHSRIVSSFKNGILKIELPTIKEVPEKKSIRKIDIA